MAANQEVKLFGSSISPFTRRVEIALNMKGVEYEYIEENLSNKSPSLLKYNPVHKKVPVLLHNGNPIAESVIILEYIDETWKSGTPILPVDPYERANARFWAKFIDDKCWPAVWKTFIGQGEEQAKAIEEAKEHLKTLENELKGNKFFGGASIGLVDIVANFIGLWVGIFQEIKGVELLTKDKFPKLIEWSEEYLKCSVIKEKLPPREELLHRYQALFG